jgi:CMP-N,N'-diacetyllegionaminic acid synthase
MKIYIDIDNTICNSPDTMDYTKSTPIQENINKGNKLYDSGNEITYWTARGMNSGLDWRKLTRQQLKQWGVKYHKLKFKKPPFDLFIDDKVLNAKDWV